MTQEEKYAEKIARLLRKAESTSSSEEAEALVEKAQELMQTWAIDDAMLAAASGKQVQDEIVQTYIHYTGVYSQALFDIGWAVAEANNCRVMITKNIGIYDKETGKSKKGTSLTLIGFKSDTERVKMLDSSIQIQATAALNRWWKSYTDQQYLSAMEKFKAKRQFLFSFATGLRTRLRAANQVAKAQAVQNEASRQNVDSGTAGDSVSLVLKSKADQVKEWQDKKYGKRLRSSTRRYQSGSYAAAKAGHEAGQRADIGQPKVSTRKELPR